jgi:hypothetical protein
MANASAAIEGSPSSHLGLADIAAPVDVLVDTGQRSLTKVCQDSILAGIF